MRFSPFSVVLGALQLLTLVNADPLVNFQLTQPPIVPKNAKQCTVRIMKRDFAFSYYEPEIVQYTPPKDCGPVGSWAAITLNFTSSINGTQYDRLGVLSLHDVEIWRTVTSQPLRGDGVVWSYIKDVSRYTPLFEKSGPLVLQLDNIVQPGLDGVFATTLDATFYASSPRSPPVKRADLIIPLSTFEPKSNAASVPPGFSINVTLPQNAVQAFVEIQASGNGQEEFWYLNVPDQYADKLPPGTTDGHGPFREVRLLVDGRVAGVAFPYATIYTGGFVPAAWKPIPAYPAHDMPTYFVDLTPFVPLLADGKPHQLTIDVASAEADHIIHENWYVSGILQVFTSKSNKATRGRITEYSVEPYARATVKGSVDEATGDVSVTTEASRRLAIAAEVIEGNGKVNRVRWTQDLKYVGSQVFAEEGTLYKINQVATGQVGSKHNGIPTLIDRFDWPLHLNFSLINRDSTRRKLDVDHIYDRELLPLPIVIGSKTFNHQIASGLYTIASTGNFGNGTNSNVFRYSDTEGNTYKRQVTSVFNNITLDVVEGNLAPRTGPIHHPHFDLPPDELGSITDVGRFPRKRFN